VLFEDDTLQIGVKSEFHGALGRIALFIGNKLSTTLSEVNMTIEYPNAVTQNGLGIRFHDAPVHEIAGKAQIQELLHVECKEFFSDLPVLRMTYLANNPRTLVLRLPVFLTRFVEGVSLEQAAFFERWKIIGGQFSSLERVYGKLITRSA
jgi:AP-2 complex subunit alpha